jgi:dTDP-4-dehydrorhamnose 3,5-epimerase-like enzyme
VYNDPQLAINWQLPSEDLLLSEKDLLLKNLNDIGEILIF